ncbi:MAG: Rpn family recombination-promoting nuclease/putative transposase [Nostoc sp. DedVER02]|uniref:Rpn family recombination-promoting nuclease/putative transposase n=1 Tax=unclassified Nostoc TaxID=2593658 RepID=UPI002AD46EA0|nr:MULTISPECIES: Rpn family recombination-promoting nuclease/putative transposase [unclassified Nostoc]MDZ7990358.1 Rpn family recombination-promoting nuclease/putative transposase [Nostoc sp. DedVER02]MDZ8115951.1 Rpn family recombination-promoting nuclease/putative transposase [Nostoc sp. DedVER01b]
MAKAADIGSKGLINLAPDAWVQWVTQRPEVVAKEILGSEFHWISRETDVLVKAYSATHGDFLVLNELQLRYTTQMPLRMRAYTALAQERYRLPTYPVLINILPPSSTLTIVNSYEQEFLGLRAIQDYRVINLWEIDAEIVFQQPLPSLLPFVPILRGGGEVSVVQRALQALRADRQLNELESLLAFFASFVLDTPLVQQMMRWDMAVLRESPWYHEIEQRGIQEGARRQLIRVLEQRFGEISHEVEVRLEGKNVEQLEILMDSAIAVNSLDEFVQILST